MSILGRAITVIQSNKHPKMAVNSLINGHSSCPLNLKMWSLESQKEAVAWRRL